MARRRISLQRIAKDAARRATFKKRRKGLIKKASELATLCGVDVCLVVYGEDDTQPEVWPSLPQATAVLDRFKNLPETQQYKKTMNQGDFLQQHVAKLHDEVNRAKSQAHESEMNLLLHNTITGRLPEGLGSLNVEQLTSLDKAVKIKMKAVADRLAELNEQAPLLSVPLAPPYTTMAANSSGVTAAPLPPLGRLKQEQQAWLLNAARNGGNLGTVVYSGYMGGASTSASASTNPNPIAGGHGDIMMAPVAPQLPGTGAEPVDYGWAWPNDQPGPSVPPM